MDEERSEDVWADKVLVTYPVTVAYSITNIPPGWTEVPDVRTERQAVRLRVLKNAWSGNPDAMGWDPAVNDVECLPKSPYKPGTDPKQTVSYLTFQVQALERRTDAPAVSPGPQPPAGFALLVGPGGTPYATSSGFYRLAKVG
jgi:hypothetical protein